LTAQGFSVIRKIGRDFLKPVSGMAGEREQQEEERTCIKPIFERR
jgi:hypothetical protein